MSQTKYELEKKSSRNSRVLKKGPNPSPAPSSHQVCSTLSIQIFPMKIACYSERGRAQSLNVFTLSNFSFYPLPAKPPSPKPPLMTKVSEKTGLGMTQMYIHQPIEGEMVPVTSGIMFSREYEGVYSLFPTNVSTYAFVYPHVGGDRYLSIYTRLFICTCIYILVLFLCGGGSIYPLNKTQN